MSEGRRAAVALLQASSWNCATGSIRCLQRQTQNQIDFKSHGADAFTSSSGLPSGEHKQNEGNKSAGGVIVCAGPPGNDTPCLPTCTLPVLISHLIGRRGRWFTDKIPGVPVAGFYCRYNYPPKAVIPPSVGQM